jgi:hypothetical protein
MQLPIRQLVAERPDPDGQAENSTGFPRRGVDRISSLVKSAGPVELGRTGRGNGATFLAVRQPRGPRLHLPLQMRVVPLLGCGRDARSILSG